MYIMNYVLTLDLNFRIANIGNSKRVRIYGTVLSVRSLSKKMVKLKKKSVIYKIFKHYKILI